MNSPRPVHQAEPRVPETNPESPGRPVQTASSCSPTETAWWRTPVEQGPREREKERKRMCGGRRDEEEEEEDRSAVSSEGHWPQSSQHQPEILTAIGGGGGTRAADSRVSLVLMGEDLAATEHNVMCVCVCVKETMCSWLKVNEWYDPLRPRRARVSTSQEVDVWMCEGL